MGAALTLSQHELAVEPGDEAPVEVEVRSTTAVVDQFELQVLGPAGGWARVEPAALSLLPGAKATATVTFAVPRMSSVAAGEVPFAVRAASLEDPDRPAVEEGALLVRPFADLVVELLPRTSSGVRRGRHEVAFDNYGNAPVTAVLGGADPDLMLSFRFEPPELVAEPGEAVFAQLRVKPRRPLWRGPPQARPFAVAATVAGHKQPLAAEGLFLQRPRIPSWAAKMALLLTFLTLGLAFLWVAVLKPTVASTAKEAVSDPLAEQAAQTADLASRQTEAGIGVEGSTLETLADAKASGVTEALTGESSAEAYSVRLAVNGTDVQEQSATIPKGKEFAVMDVLFQNPNGDAGSLELRRDGEVLLRNALPNFRDLDFHFLSPLVFHEGQRVILRVECTSPDPCTPAAYLGGQLKDVTPGAKPPPPLKISSASG
jgi:hypothetical protein